MSVCVLQTRLHEISPLSLALTHTHSAAAAAEFTSLRQKDLRPPCCCLGESATQRTPEAGRGTAEGSPEMAKASTASKQFLAGNNRLLSRLRAHLQCAAHFTQSRAEREQAEGARGGGGERETATTGCSRVRGRGNVPFFPKFPETKCFPGLLKIKQSESKKLDVLYKYVNC